ncbi:MAG: hypothetical protein MUC63_04350, partial [Planctomycetes bacterium]|nr:hypothetical protein [Planctomycetota bacterium]
MDSTRRIRWFTGLTLVLAAAAPSALRAGEEAALLAALDKAAQSGKTFKEMVADAKPAVQAAPRPAHEAAISKLKDEYATAKSMLEEAALASSALRLSILGLAANELANTATFGDCRIIPWQEIFDLAESSSLDRSQQVEAAAKLAKLWGPMWDGLFDEVMKGHRAAESK